MQTASVIRSIREATVLQIQPKTIPMRLLINLYSFHNYENVVTLNIKEEISDVACCLHAYLKWGNNCLKYKIMKVYVLRPSSTSRD